MNDNELLKYAFGLPTIFLDGFGAFRKTNGVLRCIGWALDTGPQQNFVISLAGAALAQAETHRVLYGEDAKSIRICPGTELAQ